MKRWKQGRKERGRGRREGATLTAGRRDRCCAGAYLRREHPEHLGERARCDRERVGRHSMKSGSAQRLPPAFVSTHPLANSPDSRIA